MSTVKTRSFKKINEMISRCSRPNSLIQSSRYTLQPIEECNSRTGWVHKEPLLGEGVSAKVYKAVCGKNDAFIVKIIDHDNFNEWLKTLDPHVKLLTPKEIDHKIQQEISIQQVFAKVGLAPQIVEAFVCKISPVQSFIIMKPLKMTVQTLLQSIASNNVNWQTQIFQKMHDLIKQSHEMGYSHKDSHTKNFMVDIPEGKENDMNAILETMKFIDFGEAVKITSSNKHEVITNDWDLFLSNVNMQGSFAPIIWPQLDLSQEFLDILKQQRKIHSKWEELWWKLSSSPDTLKRPGLPISPLISPSPTSYASAWDDEEEVLAELPRAKKKTNSPQKFRTRSSYKIEEEDEEKEVKPQKLFEPQEDVPESWED